MVEVIFFERRGEAPAADHLRVEFEAGHHGVLGSFERAIDHVTAVGTTAGMPHTRIIDRENRIWELRFGASRIAYIIEGESMVLLNGWRKKSQKLDAREAAKAARYAEEWRSQHA